jgi:hypothetical protein
MGLGIHTQLNITDILDEPACVLILACTGDFQELDAGIYHDLEPHHACSFLITLENGVVTVTQSGKPETDNLALFPGEYKLASRSKKAVAHVLSNSLAGVLNEDAIPGLARALYFRGEIKATLIEMP